MRNIASLVVLVLILVLAGGLVILGIARVRDAANRINCCNNLKQIGLSIWIYQEQQNAFPPAAMPNPELPPDKRISWMVAIMPYVEANDLYSKMNKEKGWDAEENRFASLTPMKVFHCPAYPEGQPVSTLIASDYLGIAGVGADAAALPAGDPHAGLFGYDRKTSVADIDGGTGTLLAVAETGQASGSWTAGGQATVRGLEPGGPPYLAVGGPFGGYHWNGTNVMMADGSQRSLNRNTAPEVLEAMAVLHHKDSTPPEE